MSLTVPDAGLAASRRTRAGVPTLPPWVLPRARLDLILDIGAEGVLTVVAAPTGAGKTLGVASWAAGPSSPRGAVVWLNLSRGGAEPDMVWRLLHRGLRESGETRLPPVPAGRASTRARVQALVELGEAMRGRDPVTVVLDGFPTGTPTQLGSELELVLEHARRALRLVVLSRGEPALDLHRMSAAGDLVRATAADLVMDDVEIAGVLRLANAPAGRLEVTTVADHTTGWACGVRRAAVALGSAPGLDAAMAETDHSVEDFLTHEVLAALPSRVRRLLEWTSVVEVVPPGAVRSVLGAGCRDIVVESVARTGLVQLLRDGSLACHPLLRSAARAQLAMEQPPGTCVDLEKLIRWFAGHGEPEAAVELCLAVDDHGRAAAVLLEAHGVPRILAGTASAQFRYAAHLPQVQAAAPLLGASVALAGGDLLAAERALATPAPRRSLPAQLLATAAVQLAYARLSGRPPAEPGLVSQTRGLLAQSAATAPQPLEDLSVLVDALTGAVEVSTGHLDRAAVVLARGADHPVVGESRRSSTDCAGQLALLEAYRGNLGQALRRAHLVLTTAEHGQPGVAHAQLAVAWVHADRGELAQARERLEVLVGSLGVASDPWLVLARHVLVARLLIASGRPDEALRLTPPWAPELDAGGLSDWLNGLVTAVSAEALLASGEPRQALALVTSGLAAGSVERAVFTAMARRELGDLRGAGAAITSVADELRAAPRTTQLQGWLLGARVAHERGELDRTSLLVERALRAAGAERLRRPLAGDAAWLRWFLDGDGRSLREHRPFVQSLLARGPVASRATRTSTGSADPMLEPLTERESQVLELLAQMCSTEEIAAELLVSANTVKTHLKGIFRKYGVNRRVDAVRRGRELGLC